MPSSVLDKVHHSVSHPGTTLVLYVEDDLVSQHVLYNCLAEQANITVESTSGADDTLEFLSTSGCLPDIILMDNQLIGTTGAEVRPLAPSDLVSIQGRQPPRVDKSSHSYSRPHSKSFRITLVRAGHAQLQLPVPSD